LIYILPGSAFKNLKLVLKDDVLVLCSLCYVLEFTILVLEHTANVLS
jgi:hypothetical protein